MLDGSSRRGETLGEEWLDWLGYRRAAMVRRTLCRRGKRKDGEGLGMRERAAGLQGSAFLGGTMWWIIPHYSLAMELCQANGAVRTSMGLGFSSRFTLISCLEATS